MAITRVVGQGGGTFGDETSPTRAFGSNVTAGNLIIVTASKLVIGESEPFLAAHCTKSAGTATIGTITLDESRAVSYNGSSYVHTAIWSIPVTGTGSCTIQITGNTNRYISFATDEITGVDVSVSRVDASNGATSASDGVAPDSGNVLTTGAAIFVGVLASHLNDANSITADGAFTSVYEQETTDHALTSMIERIVTGATTDSASWASPANVSGDAWAASVVAYKAAGGSTATATPGVGSVVVQGRAPLTSAFTNVRIREVLVNESGQVVGGAANITLLVWYSGRFGGAPDVSLNGMTTDAAGTTSWSIATGTLAYQQPIAYVAQDSLSYSKYTCARMIPSYE